MAEIQDSPSPENAAELPKTTPLSAGDAADGTKSGFIEKIRGIGERAYSKTVEAVKRGRGRPPGTGKNQRAEAGRMAENAIPRVPLSDNSPVADLVNSPAATIFDGTLIKRVVSSIVKGACTFGKMRVTDAAIGKGASDEQAERLANKCDATDDELDDFGTFAGILLKKYSVDMKYAEEAAFCAVGAGIGVRFVAVLSEIKRMPYPQKS